jgi:putative transposase
VVCEAITTRICSSTRRSRRYAHPGSKAAIARVNVSPWQRCTVGSSEISAATPSKDQHGALGALIRQPFTAADAGKARRRLGDAVTQLQARLPKLAALREDAEDASSRSTPFRPSTCPSSPSPTRWNALAREIGRRTDVVGIFPDDPSLIRLVPMLAIEANDEWPVGRSYISPGSMTTLYDTGSRALSRSHTTSASAIDDRSLGLLGATVMAAAEKL